MSADTAGAALPTPRAHLTSDRTRAALTLQGRFLAGARDFLVSEGFTELLPPTIGPVTDPGARGAKQVDIDYYGHRYKLMTSGILYKQASLLSFDKIFHVAPNVRLEPLETAVTHRHLVEFHQLDVEIAGASREDAMDVAERLTKHCVEHVLSTAQEQLEILARETEQLKQVCAAPYGRKRHSEAVAELRATGYDQAENTEIEWEGEEIISAAAPHPFFITDYPKGSRGFYDKENTEDPGVLRNFDLIFPGGFGEMMSGSEREADYRNLMMRIRETGENPAKYEWYLTLAREGIPSSAGFGLGVERFTRFLGGLDAVWQASGYPKLPGEPRP
ncbi:asparagine synthetase A [Streptacidiphilus jiangxiensis]|uniref:Asparaginyl-tRNA synthetase n=1 Tax=Streptacidiphilus jiangxiensis TaxID=235985 RepID=A0A1H7VKR8_STRJI|nr:asparagine synthetase A [Streptacidiphilus jiangxiensis]SEM09861.1 asparaginyl-tRNA synthetase [Streptacidiphilus jiangxiensis]